MDSLPNKALFLTDEASDKEYHVEIRSTGNDAFRVFVRYGKRGKKLREDDSSKKDVDFETAKKEFESIVTRQTKKGYTDDISGTPFKGTEKESLGRFAVSRHKTESGSVTIASGFLEGFFPAEMRQPSYSFMVNPAGYDDPDSQSISASSANLHFESYNVDGGFYILSSDTDIDTLVSLTKKTMLDEAGLYLECDTGGCLSFSVLEDGHFLVSAFDNGGSDLAESSLRQSVSSLGITPLSEHFAAHFTRDRFPEQEAMFRQPESRKRKTAP